MNYNNQERKSLSSQSAVNSVSATQLLKALQTLQNINIVQNIEETQSITSQQKQKIYNINLVKSMENINIVIPPSQIQHDLNISFSQTQNFNPLEIIHQQQNVQNAAKNVQSTGKQMNKSVKLNSSIKGKMNFQFYMCKKQTSNSSKSPRISNKNSTFKKTFQNKKQNNKTPVKFQSKNKSLSPLTERSINLPSSDYEKSKNHKVFNEKDKTSKVIDRKQRIKTQAYQKQKQKKSQFSSYKKQNTLFGTLKVNQNINKQNQKPKNVVQLQANNHINTKLNLKLKKPFQQNIQNQSQQSKQSTKSHQHTNSFHNLSVHQRTKQYLKQKNQRLQKLTKQIQQKRKQQELQCTFKPKIIPSNVKSKYNDLCNAHQFQQKHNKRCKHTKNQDEEFLEKGQHNRTLQGRKSKATNNTNNRDFKKKVNQHLNDETSNATENSMKIQNQNSSKLLLKCYSKQLEQQSNSRVSNNESYKQKPKYKNTKFNTLLDMIH